MTVEHGSKQITEADRRGLARLVRSGRAVVVRFKGHWLCGGEALAQATVRRLVQQGFAKEDPVGVVHPTERGIVAAGDAGRRSPSFLADQDVAETVRGKIAHPDDRGGDEEEWFTDGAEPWSPPDVRNGDDVPVALDAAMEEGETT